MEAVIAFARDGGPVLGICNGFQVLCEAGLLPGALLPNDHLRFRCRQVEVEVAQRRHRLHARVRRRASGCRSRASTRPGATGRPTSSSTRSRPSGQVVLRYAPGENPNGSARDIAGVCNEAGNVMGLMPHPEHAVDELCGGSADGLKLFAVGGGRWRHA